MKTDLDRPTRPDPLESGAAPAFDLTALSELAAGCTIAFPPQTLHSVHAAEDSAILIVLGSSD